MSELLLDTTLITSVDIVALCFSIALIYFFDSTKKKGRSFDIGDADDLKTAGFVLWKGHEALGVIRRRKISGKV